MDKIILARESPSSGKQQGGAREHDDLLETRDIPRPNNDLVRHTAIHYRERVGRVRGDGCV